MVLGYPNPSADNQLYINKIIKMSIQNHDESTNFFLIFHSSYNHDEPTNFFLIFHSSYNKPI